jgi:hypothetical protein
VKLLITLLVITAAVYGVYNFTMAAYGWFQMSTIVDEVAKEELAKPSSGFTAFDARDRFGRIRERILKGAKEASVDLRPENVQLNVVNNVVDVQLAWEAPMVVYGDKTYLQIPMTMQRGFPVKPR